VTEPRSQARFPRVPRRRYVAAGLWAAAQIVVAGGGVLLVFLTAMRGDGCAFSCRDDVANVVIDGMKAALLVITLIEVAMLVIALINRASPHVIGGVAIGLSLAVITVASVLMVSASPVPP